MSSVAATAHPEITISSIPASRHSPTKSRSSPQRVNQRVLTPVVVCGSPCAIPAANKEGLLSPLLTAAAAAASSHKSAGATNVLPQNNVPASESEKLTATNIYVLRELERPRPRPSDIESTVCPQSVEPFRKAWWAGVRPTTCERTCRHRSKVCDAIQLCNDCTGYYCKWLADLVGIPVLKASGRVDPVIFEKDKLARLYWERISKVACCPKVTAKCLMCIRRYQLFTHFLPGNLDFRTLVHESVMKLHEEGFAVDMGLIRKVTRRHLECIADSMELSLPVEYVSSYQAYDIIVRRGPLVDVLANGLSSALQQSQSSYQSVPRNGSQRGSTDITNSPRRSVDHLAKQASLKDNATSSTSDSIGDPSSLDLLTRMELDNNNNRKDGAPTRMSHVRRLRRSPFSNDSGDNPDVKRRSKRQVKRPREEMFYGEENEFLSMLDDDDHLVDDQVSEDSEGNTRRRRKKQQRTPTTTFNSDRQQPRQFTSPTSLQGFELDGQFAPLDGRESTDGCVNNPTFDSLIDQFGSSLDNEVSVDTETVRLLSSTRNRQSSPFNYREPARGGPDVLQQHLKSPLNCGNLDDMKIDNLSRFDLSNGSPAAIDRLAAAVLQRLDHQRAKSRQEHQTVTDAVHRRELSEETRLSESGVRGIFWDPSKEGWCALLPLTPNYTDEGLASMKRKILCFPANTLKSIESAKWSAVYERLRRNPRELEFLTRDVREDLSNWVKENIELSLLSSSPTSLGNENREGSQGSSCIGTNTQGYPQQSVGTNNQGYLDLSHLDGATASALLNTASTGKLTELLGSLAKQIAILGGNTSEPRQQDTLTTTTSPVVENTDVVMTSTTGSSGEEQQPQPLTGDDKQASSVSNAILGILATLQAKLPAADFSPQQQQQTLPAEGIKLEGDQ